MDDRCAIKYVFLRCPRFLSDCLFIFIFSLEYTVCFYEALVCVLFYNLGSDPFLKTWGFVETSDIHTYSTRSVLSKSFYVQRTSLVKSNQSLKISGVKVWNSLPGHIRDKVFTSSDKTSSKILKLYFLKSRTCL